MTDLLWTGERLVTSVTNETMIEHLQRYYFAEQYCNGKHVLDIASGEGYGSSILGRKSLSVVGVDIDSSAVEHANRKYGSNSIQFLVGSATSIPVGDNTIDVVVSFETIEHFSDHESFVNEVLRVLKPDGLFVISSPDKHTYSDASGFKNEHHVRELYEQEFVDLMSGHFQTVTTYHQRFAYGCFLLPIAGGKAIDVKSMSYEECRDLPLNAEYVLCVATNSNRQPIEALGTFSDFSGEIQRIRVDRERLITIQGSRLYRLLMRIKLIIHRFRGGSSRVSPSIGNAEVD